MSDSDDEVSLPKAAGDLDLYERPKMLNILSDLKKFVHFNPAGDQSKDNEGLRELKRGIANYMSRVFATRTTGRLRKQYPADTKHRVQKI